MTKAMIKDPTMIFPMPTVMVSCADKAGKPNIISLGYVGFFSWKPSIVGIGISPMRYSNQLIKDTKEFVINVPNKEQLKLLDYCGFVSGKDVDKFSKTGLTLGKAEKVSVPIIEECPVNLECIVKDIVSLGSHDLFIAEVVNAKIDEQYAGNSAFDPIILLKRSYYPLNASIGEFGESGGSL